MSLSVTLPAKKFQLFHPIGGVAATVCALAPPAKIAKTRARPPAPAIAPRTRIPSLPLSFPESYRLTRPYANPDRKSPAGSSIVVVPGGSPCKFIRQTGAMCPRSHLPGPTWLYTPQSKSRRCEMSTDAIFDLTAAIVVFGKIGRAHV